MQAPSQSLNQGLTSINEVPDENIDALDAQEEGYNDEKEIGMLLRFSKQNPITRDVTHFYQRTLLIGHHVSHCSVSDEYIVYSIVEEEQSVVTEAFGSREFDNVKKTSIVVINIQTKEEVTI